MKEIDRPPPPRLGTVQGVIQAALIAGGMSFGSALSCLFHSNTPTRGFGVAMVLGLVVPVALGAWIDLRRGRNGVAVVLIAPPRVQYGVAAMVVLACVAAFVLSMPMDLGRAGSLACLAPFVLAVAGFAAAAVDRVVGPAWVLGCALREAWSRRRWIPLRILDVHAGRVRLISEPDGRIRRVRGSGVVPGAGWGLVEGDSDRAGYRDDASEHLTAFESAEQRRRRRAVQRTAALGLAAGLLWIAVALGPPVGGALTEHRGPGWPS